MKLAGKKEKKKRKENKEEKERTWVDNKAFGWPNEASLTVEARTLTAAFV